jgi:phage terminase Nu1 subunit (DNA packaging protein)
MSNETPTAGSYYKVEVIASLFGVSVRRVQQLTQDGIIETVQTKDGRRYDLGPSVQKYIAYLSDKAYGRDQNKRETELREQKLKADIALKESQGELHQLRTAIAAGKFISVEEVQVDYSKFFVIFKKFALSIPSRVAGTIATVVDPVTARAAEKDLTREINGLLQGFVIAGKVDGEGSDGT